jgi:hypothetical protein
MLYAIKLASGWQRVNSEGRYERDEEEKEAHIKYDIDALLVQKNNGRQHE